jgi:citrate lyase subunit beta/citryl-CoA lyase
MGKKFLRRSLIYIPGSSQKMIGKAKDVPADSIIFDLEDAVSMLEKDNARQNVIAAIRQNRSIGKELVVRVNGMDSAHGVKDVLAMAEVRPDTLIIPKADEKAMIVAGMILTAFEKEAGLTSESIGLIPLIETTQGIVTIERILHATQRISGVQLGAEDLTKEQGIERTSEGDEIQHARATLAFAACSCGIDIIDTPYTGIHDVVGLEKDTMRARSIGFTGKTCIHPSHIEIINRIFTPKTEAVDHARRLVAAFDEAVSKGKGACMFEGKMIDNPIAERARKVLEKSNQIKGRV